MRESVHDGRSTGLAGRDAELARLLALGRDAALLIAGEAGSGKTSVVRVAAETLATETPEPAYRWAVRAADVAEAGGAVSEKTVSVHVSNMLRKTGSAGRIELIRMAQRTVTAGPR